MYIYHKTKYHAKGDKWTLSFVTLILENIMKLILRIVKSCKPGRPIEAYKIPRKITICE